jgi:hypothetical protein
MAIMESEAKSHVDKLIVEAIEQNARFWAGEYEVARSYFRPDNPGRTPERERRWLGLQIWKEWYGSGVYGPEGVDVRSLIVEAGQRMASLDPMTHISEIEGIIEHLSFAVDELRHFALFSDVLRAVEGHLPESMDGLKGICPGRKLTEFRYQLRKEPLGEVAVVLSEGGGLGLFFGIQDILTEAPSLTDADRLLLTAVEAVLDEETGHLGHNFREARDAGYTEDDWRRINGMLQDINHVKLEERYGQFGMSAEDSSYQTAVRGENGWRAFVSEKLPFLFAALGLPMPA